MKTILIIDDDSDSNLLLCSDLKAAGYNVLTEVDAKQGVETAMEVRPDLIIMDVLMPGLYGSEAAEKLYANNSTTDIPLIFLSGILDKSGNGSHDSVVTVHGRKYHAFPKDIHNREILSAIQQHLTPQNSQNSSRLI